MESRETTTLTVADVLAERITLEHFSEFIERRSEENLGDGPDTPHEYIAEKFPVDIDEIREHIKLHIVQPNGPVPADEAFVCGLAFGLNPLA